MKIKLALIGLLLSSCVVVKHECPKPEMVLQDTLIWRVGPMTPQPIEYNRAPLNEWPWSWACETHNDPNHIEVTIDTYPSQKTCYTRQ